MTPNAKSFAIVILFSLADCQKVFVYLSSIATLGMCVQDWAY